MPLLSLLLRYGLLSLLGLLGGCSTLSYYGQLADGQMRLLMARKPVAELLAGPQLEPQLRQKLQLSQQARSFASSVLALPNNTSYRLYADIQRPYVVWNLFATPEFSLQPLTHCFPIAGCVAYQGYYREADAQAAAERLRAEGLETYVTGVEAYSTLGWFADPILSSMLRWGDQRLVDTIFHELAHQQYYLPGDTAFNESFASFVEAEGGRRWRQSRGLLESPPSNARQHAFVQLILRTRERLQRLYESAQPVPELRQAKAQIFAKLRRDYQQLVDHEWAGQRYFASWMDGSLNNAALLPFGLYDHWVPAFARLFHQVGGNWPAFYARVEKLGALPEAQRRAALQGLLAEQPD